MEDIFKDFTKVYSVAKTLRFSLIPQWETEKYIQKVGILQQDEDRAKKYQLAKQVLDTYHREFIEEKLSEFEYDWNELYQAFEQYEISRSDKDRKELEKVQKKAQTAIYEHLKKGLDELTPKKLIDDAISENPRIPITEDDREAMEFFKGFATYFQGYQTVRKNIYKAEGAASIAERIVRENFPKYYWNCKLFYNLPETFAAEAESAIAAEEDTNNFQKRFSPEGFKTVLTQNGINKYNQILGGKTENETSKIKGLNEYCNLAFQKGDLMRRVRFAPLLKQILSDRTSVSFIPTPYMEDSEVKAAVYDLCSHLKEYDLQKLYTVFDSSELDTNLIYVDKKQIPELSRLLFDNQWRELYACIRQKAEQEFGTGKNANTKIEQFCNRKIYTVNELQGIVGAADKKILPAIKEQIKRLYDIFLELFEKNQAELQSPNKIQSFDPIKKLLDAVQEMEKTMKIVAAPAEVQQEALFYSVFGEVYDLYRSSISVYNKVRNYATKKPYSVQKYKLNFFNPQFAGGWDKNKEQDYKTLLFRKNGIYYLGVMNADDKPSFRYHDDPMDSDFEKMVYKFLPGPNKMLPKVFITSDSGKKNFQPSEAILNGYSGKKHTKGNNFDLSFCHDLIEFFKESIAKHPDWSQFGFRFSDTSSYNDISDFYREIEKQSYFVRFTYISQEELHKAVSDGQLYLFQIYNKDFSTKSTGTPNLHTLYWRELFSPQNLKKPVLKLNGGAELFYRPASIENPFIHEQGSTLIKKRKQNGTPVEQRQYEEALRDAQSGMSIEELTEKYPALEFRKAPHDIVKDRRYSKASYSFHVPITLNFAASQKNSKINQKVLEVLKGNQEVNIIGIDRGERNLLYICCIDQKGNILEQRSMNIVNGTDYHTKLDAIEKRRDEERKAWKRIDQIKEMKEGYLSAAVHEVTEMMLRYNAIVVLEDLNSGFKRGRFRIEKQVYQKFEKMLIDKLNYLADKKRTYEPGGIANAYQLTEKFESFQNLGKQSGFLFYVSAAYTSKIDPATGFVSLFPSEQLRYSSVDKARKFFQTFHAICFDQETQSFRFSFRYSDFKLYMKDYTDRWTVYTTGDERINTVRQSDGRFKTERINVTERLMHLFRDYNIDPYCEDLQAQILEQDQKAFFSDLLNLFRLTVTLRHTDNMDDYILSPVRTEDGFFDSRKYRSQENSPFPKDADANGAYHIALKGLRVLKECIEDGKIKPDKKGMQTYHWLRFVQEKEFAE